MEEAQQIFPSKQEDEEDEPYHGNPPWHAVALVGSFIAVFAGQLPSFDAWDKTARYETFSHVLFPEILPLSAVIAIRMVFALIVLADSFRAFALVVFIQETEYYPGSKLKAGAPIEYRGILTKGGSLASGALGLASFTGVTWMLEGIAFFLAAMIPLCEWKEHTTLYRLALITWDIVAPSAFLVSLVVTYVLWPIAILAEKQGKKGNLGLLNRLGPLLAHNLNVLAITTEFGILGGLPIQLGHFAMAPLYGSMYILFSWAMKDGGWLPQLTCEKRKAWGSQFVYPFLDTSLGWQSTLSLFVLLIVLLVSHVAVCGLSWMLKSLSLDDSKDVVLGRFTLHFSFILVVGLVVCRFR